MWLFAWRICGGIATTWRPNCQYGIAESECAVGRPTTMLGRTCIKCYNKENKISVVFDLHQNIPPQREQGAVDYADAYRYVRGVFAEDEKVRPMAKGETPVDWDTIYDRLADAYMAGAKEATPTQSE